MAKKKPEPATGTDKPENENENQAPLSNAELAWLRKNVLV